MTYGIKRNGILGKQNSAQHRAFTGSRVRHLRATGQRASIARSKFAAGADLFFVCLLASTEEIPEYLFAKHCPLPLVSSPMGRAGMLAYTERAIML